MLCEAFLQINDQNDSFQRKQLDEMEGILPRHSTSTKGSTLDERLVLKAFAATIRETSSAKS